nr:wax ester/triacylglycerol synthase domain-containing protein [Nocardia sp. BMG111209]
MAPADAFFLHVENAGPPQQVGGLVVLEPGAAGPTVRDLRELVRAELDGLPRFRQRLLPGGRWRRARWVDGAIDWEWHVAERVVAAGDPVAELRRVVGELAAEPLPRDRPLWRMVLVRERDAGPVGVILLVHHAVADGVGTVVQALRLLRPRTELRIAERGGLRAGAAAVATATGLAQLAADARPRGRMPVGSDRRRFVTAELDLETVRGVAHSYHARVTDILLAVVVIALRRTRPDLMTRLRGPLRVAVPLMVRGPRSAAEGNLTAAVMIDIPLHLDDPAELLADIVTRGDRLHSGTRALASRFVMATGLRILPEPLAGRFAATVYGGRFFHAIVSNMAGPDRPLTLANAAVAQVFPILPPASGVPLVVGALSWAGRLGLGISADPELVDPTGFAAELPTVLAELGPAPVADPGPPVGSGE